MLSSDEEAEEEEEPGAGLTGRRSSIQVAQLKILIIFKYKHILPAITIYNWPY